MCLTPFAPTVSSCWGRSGHASPQWYQVKMLSSPGANTPGPALTAGGQGGGCAPPHISDGLSRGVFLTVLRASHRGGAWVLPAVTGSIRFSRIRASLMTYLRWCESCMVAPFTLSHVLVNGSRH